MSEKNDISKKLEETLNNYGGVLDKCTKAMKDNTMLNNEKIIQINELVKKIKDRIFKCNEKLKLINDNRKIFDESKQEKEKQLKSAIEESKLNNEQRMRELQEKQRLQEEENRRKIAEIESKSKSDLEETQRKLNEQHKNELQVKIDALTKSQENTAALEERQKEAQLELESIKEENNKQMAANESDMERKKNELEGAKKSLEENQKKLESIMTGIVDKDKKIEALNNEVTNLNKKLEEQIREAEGRIEQLGEEKNKIIKEKTAAIEDLNNKHNIRIKELGEEHEKQIEELTNNLTAEFERQKQEAIEQTEKSIQAAADEKLSASNTTTQNLQEQIDQCNTDKENFTKQLTNAQATINELTSKYDNVEGNNFDELTKSVDDIGNNEVKQLENLLNQADDVIRESGEIAGTDPSQKVDAPNDPVPKLESDETDLPVGWKETTDPNSGQIYYYNETTGAVQWEKPTMGNLKVDETRKSEVSGDLHPLGIEQKWVKRQLERLPKIKNNLGNKKAREAFVGILKEGIEKYINNIGSYKDFVDLKHRIVDPKLHGMTDSDGFSDSYREAMDSVTETSFRNDIQRHLYKKILEYMVTTDSNAYKYIIQEISVQKGFEKVFEQLITAFHLLYSPNKIKSLYTNDSRELADSYMRRNGKLAIRLWYGNYDRDSYEPNKVTVKQLKDNAKNNEDALIGANDTQIEMKHKYYHTHDHRNGRRGFSGGFRHGKKSKKQNRRSLKSKLMAKKFSLKSKKKGKNKSKKRRKSIKIRIN